MTPLQCHKTSIRQQTTRRCIDSCNNAVCPQVNVKLIKKTRIPGVSWQKDFAFETELYSKISVWKKLKCISHYFQTLEAVAQWCSKNFARPATLLKKRTKHRCFPVNFSKFLRTTFLRNTSGGCSSFHMAINSSLSSI